LIVLDTSFVFALFDKSDSRHSEATGWYDGVRDPIVTTPLVLAELDYLLHVRATPAAVSAYHAEVRAGNLGVEWWSGLEKRAAEVAERYADIGLGLVDASLIALAGTLETNRIATFDERRFRKVEPLGGSSAFELLPADA
jgi:predicted nucleic acid-binding protein